MFVYTKKRAKNSPVSKDVRKGSGIAHLGIHSSFFFCVFVHSYKKEEATNSSVLKDKLACSLRQTNSHILRMCTNTAMGWLRLVGSLKLLVSFAEYRLFYRLC